MLLKWQTTAKYGSNNEVKETEQKIKELK